MISPIKIRVEANTQFASFSKNIPATEIQTGRYVRSFVMKKLNY